MSETTPPSDPSDPQQSSPPPSGGGGSAQTSTGLDPKLAGMLCYILGLVTGVIFFLVEKTNRTVRFHAAQSIVFSVTTIVVWVVLFVFSIIMHQISWTLGNLFGIITTLVWLGIFILWIVLLIKGYSGERWKLPVLGDVAERLAESQPAT